MAINRTGTNMHRLTVALLSLLASSVTFAQATNDALGEKLVNDFLNDIITLEARFDQSLIDAQGAVGEKTSGTLEIERPMRFRWSYTEPYEQWLIADGNNIWSYDIDLEQVTVKPQAEALANTPALLLGGAEDALEQFEFGGTTVETITTWVRLMPKNTESGFNRVELGFVEGQLRRMVFFDNLEQKTLVTLSDIKINEPIDASRFEFEIPEFVDVVGQPVVVRALEP